jgi:hypothetical protein
MISMQAVGNLQVICLAERTSCLTGRRASPWQAITRLALSSSIATPGGFPSYWAASDSLHHFVSDP